MQELVTWIGIFICLSQSAIFSGLNLAFFSVTRLRLEVEAEGQNPAAARVLAMRNDANFLLTSILWGNIAINVTLTLLADSVMAGVIAFLFSTVIITLFGEILPQAFFSRNAMLMAYKLTPLLRIYQFILYPVAKPTALLLDRWLGKEGVLYWRETDVKRFIRKHLESPNSELAHVESVGALNFLSIDDLPISSEGEVVQSNNIIALPEHQGELVLPIIQRTTSDPFLIRVNLAKQPWVVLTNQQFIPKLLLSTESFLRDALLSPEQEFDPRQYCHSPIVVTDMDQPLWRCILQIKSQTLNHTDQSLKNDVVLLWTDSLKKVITGADILGRLLKGIGEPIDN